MPFAVKMGLGGTGYLGKQEKTQRAKRRFANRRRVISGYPVTSPFTTRAEVETYLSGSTITCLLCGKRFKRLAGHIVQIHNVTTDEYRLKYRLPWGIGLASESTRQKYRDATNRRVEADPERWKEVSALGQSSSTLGHTQRRATIYHTDESTKRVLNLYDLRETYDAQIYGEFLRRIGKMRFPREVATDADMPSISTWHGYRKKNPKYDCAFKEIWESFPFPFQAKAELLGQRFRRELRALYDDGISDKIAARRLGVSAMTCNHITRKWRNKP